MREKKAWNSKFIEKTLNHGFIDNIKKIIVLKLTSKVCSAEFNVL